MVAGKVSMVDNLKRNGFDAEGGGFDAEGGSRCIVADLGFSYDGGGTQIPSWVLGVDPGFSCEIWRDTQNFHLNLEANQSFSYSFSKWSRV